MSNSYDFEHIPQILNDPARYDWFSAQLLRLMAKADEGNFRRLAEAFPEHAAAFQDWYHQQGFYAPKSSSAQGDMLDHVGRGERGNTSADSAIGSLILAAALGLILLAAIGVGPKDLAIWGELVKAVLGG